MRMQTKCAPAQRAAELCSAESRSDLTLQFLRASIHGAARREHLALLFGNRLATHADGYLGAAAVYYQNERQLFAQEQHLGTQFRP